MPADERLKVIFKRVHVRKDFDDIGDGEFFFIATVGGQTVGNRRIFPAVEGRVIELPPAEWSGTVNVLALDQVLLTFQVKESDPFDAEEDLGTAQHILRRPFKQEQFTAANEAWLLEFEIELSVTGAFGRHPPDAVFATRTVAGGVTAVTVSGNSFLARGEIHPVRPVPAPPPATALPVRPEFGGAPVEVTNSAGTAITATDPINVVPNPSVIPLLGPAAAAPAGPLTPQALDAATFANARNCSRIELTYFRPGTLAFTDGDPRLEWTVVSIAAGGNAAFLGPARGAKVMVFGTAVGEVRLECRFNGALFATYRALVRNIRQIPCRINILNGNTADSRPRASPADAKNHLDIANRSLRQLALELTLDTNPATSGGAQATAIPGIFRIPVTRGQTRNVSPAGAAAAVIRNHRPRVMNFAYIHSDSRRNAGVAMDFPNSTAAPANRVQDSGSPSTSWVRPTGVGIGADAATAPTLMNVIAGIPRAGNPLLFSMFVTDSNGGLLTPAGNHAALVQQREYATTMVHEFGHILNLGHRVEGTKATPQNDMVAGTPANQLRDNGIFWDGLLQPPRQNAMHWRDPATFAQDFDIIQARAVELSPIVTGATLVNPAPPPPPGPVPPRPSGDFHEQTIVKGDTLSKIAAQHGMTFQELFNFDGGTGIPNRKRLRSGDPNLIFPGEVILVPGPAVGDGS
jgi:hypothetical protein